MTWEQAAEYCYLTFGIQVDYEEGFFVCPECGKLIYGEDWGECDFSMCPICETDFELI